MKSIKVDDRTYKRLQEEQRIREPITQVIDRALECMTVIQVAIPNAERRNTANFPQGRFGRPAKEPDEERGL